ncbi:MAG: hypothetical protein IJR50_00170 [Treponema sp.]|nr:hypothetical protein [Treponema sp.]
MKKMLSVFIVFIVALIFCNAQVSVAPNNDFYEYAMHWHIEGLVDELPQLRPYPLSVVKKILQRVIESGNDDEIATAKLQYEKIFNKPWNISVNVEEKNLFTIYDKSSNKTDRHNNTFQITASLQGYGDFLLSDSFGIGYRAGASFSFLETADYVYGNVWNAPRYDTFIKSIDAKAAKIDFNADCIVSYSWKKIMITAGYNRTGFSFFNDGGLAFSTYARNAPQFTFMFDGKYFDFVQYFAALEASDMLGNGSRYGKFMSLRALRIRPARRFYISLYDSVIYGKRFDVSYFIPVPSLLISEANGFGDNVLSGIAFEWNIGGAISWIMDIAIDHLDIQQLARFHLNSDNRVAFKTGFVFSPPKSLCKVITLDYTLIRPYMYSYLNVNDSTYNFYSYTNGGRSIGSVMPPNSDCVLLQIKLEPMKNLKVATSVSIARHVNVYETLSDEDAEKVFAASKTGRQNSSSDGSVNTQYMSSAMLLSGGHTMVICRGGMGCSYEFPRIKAGTFSLDMNFAYMYVINAGVDEPIYHRTGTFANAKDAKANWERNLHDEYNIYLSVGFTYAY